jgi:hypothetical protein
MTFWCVKLCSSESGRRLQGIYTNFLQIQGVNISQGRNQQEAGGKQSVLLSCLLCPLILRWMLYFPPKRRSLSKLHGVVTQKTVLLTVTTEICSNPSQHTLLHSETRIAFATYNGGLALQE